MEERFMTYDVCVFGGCSLDQMYYLKNGEKVKKSPDMLVPGGKGANQAVAAARAGAKVTIITRLGKDDIGENILENLSYNGIYTNNVEMVEGLENDAAKIYIDPDNKDNDIKRCSGAINSFTPDMVERYSKVLLQSKIVVAQMKVAKEVSVRLINFCYENNIPIIITPCRPEKLFIGDEGNKELIDKITYITANRQECMRIFGTEDVFECVSLYPNKLIVTLGSEGVVYHDDNQIIKLDAINVEKVEDTTGAGDTFNGNLAYLLSAGYDLKEAIVRAQFASAMKIQKKTAQDGMPYKEELDNFIYTYYLDDSDYSSEFELAYQAIMDAADNIKKNKIISIRVKDDNTFVTASDLLAEKTIIDSIREEYPNDNFVTEEFNPTNKIKDRTWIIDPIDGTAHYMKNSLFWAIQLAFVDKGEVEFSIIYLPKLDEMYYAIKGKGAFLNNKKIYLNGDISLEQCIVEFCGSIGKKLEQKRTVFYKLLNADVKPANFMHINSCSFAFCNLLAGRTDALVVSTIKPWDVMPGLFLCSEAGLNQYNINDLTVVSNSKEFDKFVVND